VVLPLVLGGVSILASIVGTLVVRYRGGSLMTPLYVGVLVSAVLSAIAF